MEPDDGELLTVRQVAARLGVDVATVYGYERRGALSPVERRAGMVRRLRFAVGVVDAFAAAHGIAVVEPASGNAV